MSGNNVLLDTTVIVRHFRDPSAVLEKLSAFDELYVSQISPGELYYGAFKSSRPGENVTIIEQFLNAADVLRIDEETAWHYGRIAARLAENGTPIPQNDVWIAAAALQSQLPVAHSRSSLRVRRRPYRPAVVSSPLFSTRLPAAQQFRFPISSLPSPRPGCFLLALDSPAALTPGE